MRLKSFGLALAAVCVSAAVVAQSFPSKPVTLMVPYPAGGLSDTIARVINAPLGTKLGQTTLVENLGGASGSIAGQKVLDAPHDGHMVYQGSPNELILGPLALKAVKYKSEDWRMVHMISTARMGILARPGLAANTADELAALARKAAAEGKPLTYASVGVGTFYHLLGEELAQKVGAKMTHVPYKGAADVVKDLGADLVDIFITPYGAPQVALAKQGRMKFLVVLSPERQPLLPEVPSVDESRALKGYHKDIWTGYFVPKNTPEPVVQKLNADIASTLGDAKVRSTLESQNQIVAGPQTLPQAAKQYADGTAAYRQIAASIKLEAQ
jgi:tripartite-type tricarboxylate transporter receptor subunit TctC